MAGGCDGLDPAVLAVAVHAAGAPGEAADPGHGSLLRDLSAARERRRIAASLGPQDSSEAPDENIAALNLFICLVAKYFGQGDLEDSED